MKKTMTKLLVFLLAAVSSVALFGLTACGEKNPDPVDPAPVDPSPVDPTPVDPTPVDPTPVDPTPEKSYKEQVLELFDSLDNVEIDGLNTYASDYADVVGYLREKGVITVSDEERVDMNTTGGYMMDAMTGTLLEEAFAFADEAYDYGGVYLIRWDLDGEYTQYRTFGTTTTIQAGGGRYTLNCSAVSGAYALGFKSVNDVVNDWGYSYGNNSYVANEEKYNGDWSAWNEDATAAKNAADEEVANLVKEFTDIDATPDSINYYSLTDLVTALRGASLISASDVLNATDLNKLYTYTIEGKEDTYNVLFASTAVKYGNVAIYYYDSSYTWYSFTSFPVMLENLKENGTTPVYYDYVYGNAYLCWYFEDGIYTVDGEQLTLTVDAVIGNFAIVVDED